MNSKLRNPISREERHTNRIRQAWIKSAVSTVISDKLKRLHSKKRTKCKDERKKQRRKIEKTSRNQEQEKSIVIILDREPLSLSQSSTNSAPQATQDLLSQQSSSVLFEEKDIGGNKVIQFLEEEDSSQDTLEAEVHNQNREIGVCEICYRKDEETIERAACGHSACTSCWNQWLFRRYSDEKAPVCFFCRSYLDQSELTVISKPPNYSS